MPNWCFNSLRVDGSKSAIGAFKKWLGEDGFKLNKIAPLPKELDDTTSPNPDAKSKEAKALVKKYGADNWYGWRVANWGTKWDVDADVVDDSEDTISINFDSAWSPPVAAIIKLGELFPKLEFTLTYQEGGMCFAGKLTVKGDEVNDYCVDGGTDEEEYRQFCIDEFDNDPLESEDEDNS